MKGTSGLLGIVFSNAVESTKEHVRRHCLQHFLRPPPVLQLSPWVCDGEYCFMFSGGFNTQSTAELEAGLGRTSAEALQLHSGW